MKFNEILDKLNIKIIGISNLKEKKILNTYYYLDSPNQLLFYGKSVYDEENYIKYILKFKKIVPSFEEVYDNIKDYSDYNHCYENDQKCNKDLYNSSTLTRDNIIYIKANTSYYHLLIIKLDLRKEWDQNYYKQYEELIDAKNIKIIETPSLYYDDMLSESSPIKTLYDNQLNHDKNPTYFNNIIKFIDGKSKEESKYEKESEYEEGIKFIDHIQFNIDNNLLFNGTHFCGFVDATKNIYDLFQLNKNKSSYSSTLELKNNITFNIYPKKEIREKFRSIRNLDESCKEILKTLKKEFGEHIKRTYGFTDIDIMKKTSIYTIYPTDDFKMLVFKGEVYKYHPDGYPYPFILRQWTIDRLINKLSYDAEYFKKTTLFYYLNERKSLGKELKNIIDRKILTGGSSYNSDRNSRIDWDKDLIRKLKTEDKKILFDYPKRTKTQRHIVKVSDDYLGIEQININKYFENHKSKKELYDKIIDFMNNREYYILTKTDPFMDLIAVKEKPSEYIYKLYQIQIDLNLKYIKTNFDSIKIYNDTDNNRDLINYYNINYDKVSKKWIDFTYLMNIYLFNNELKGIKIPREYLMLKHNFIFSLHQDIIDNNIEDIFNKYRKNNIIRFVAWWINEPLLKLSNELLLDKTKSYDDKVSLLEQQFKEEKKKKGYLHNPLNLRKKDIPMLKQFKLDAYKYVKYILNIRDTSIDNKLYFFVHITNTLRFSSFHIHIVNSNFINKTKWINNQLGRVINIDELINDLDLLDDLSKFKLTNIGWNENSNMVNLLEHLTSDNKLDMRKNKLENILL